MAAKIILLIFITLALGAGIGLFVWHSWAPPAKRTVPRPNRRKLNLKKVAVPLFLAGAAALITILSLSLFLSSPDARNRTENNRVTNSIPARDLEAAPGELGSEEGDRVPLVAQTPLVRSALEASPVASSLETVGRAVTTMKGLKVAAASPPEEEAEPAPKPPAAKPEPEKPTPKPEPEAKVKPKPKPTADSTVHFTVHLASFGEKNNADRSLARLKAAGVPAFVSRVKIDQKVYYRLMAGRFNTKDQAEAYGQELKKKGLIAGLGQYRIKPIASAPGTG